MRSGIEVVNRFCWGIKIFRSVFGALLICGGCFWCAEDVYSASITLSVSDSITATAVPGSINTFTSDTNTANISITTSNASGYTLSIKGNSDSTALTGTNGSIPSISQSVSTLNDFTVGTWGYKPTKWNGNSWDNLEVKHGNNTYTLGHYLPSPTTVEDIIDITNKANDTPNKYNLAVATKLSNSIAKGSYGNSFVVTAITNALPLPTMQEFDCSSLNVGDITTLRDSRDPISEDSPTYKVSKLLDGKCWMLDNLALDLTNSTVLSDMDNSNTNASNTTLGYLKNGGGSSPYTAYPVMVATSSNYYNRPAVAISGKTSDGSNWNTMTVPSDSLSATGQWKVGIYYNFCVASAGSYCYSSSSSTGNATEDICPKGWRMPTGNTSGEYNNSYSEYNDYVNFRNALHLPFSGYFYDGVVSSLNNSGNFWSSTFLSENSIYVLSAYGGSIYPANGNHRDYSYPVRCVAKNPSKTVNISVNNSNYGTVATSSGLNPVIAEQGSRINTSGNPLTIGSETVTATPASSTAQYSYDFSSWSTTTCTNPLTNNCEITANFTRTTRSYTVTINNTDNNGSIYYNGNYGREYSVVKEYGSTISFSTPSVSIAGDSFSASPSTSYEFDSWDNGCGDAVTNDCTITVKYKKDSGTCLIAGTLVTLSDGTKIPVEELEDWQDMMIWNFEDGTYDSAPVTPMFRRTEPQDYNVIYLKFADGEEIGIVYDHGFYDADLNKFIYITEETVADYVNHHFIKKDGDSWTTTKLVDYRIETVRTSLYSPTTFQHINFYAGDLLSIAGGLSGMFNYFDVVPETMAYDQIKKAADIERYGLLTAKDFDGIIDEAVYEAFNGKYLGVAMGKGLLTWDDIRSYAEAYLPGEDWGDEDSSDSNSTNDSNILVDGEWNDNNEQVLNTAKEAADKLHNAI